MKVYIKKEEVKLKIEEMNFAQEVHSRYLKECMERNYGKILERPMYVRVRYFKTGLQALNWKTSIMLGEQGVRQMITLPVESTDLLAMLEWVCRWNDGSFTVLIVEENLKRWAQGDKKAIEGLSFHVLGHISDMEQRDFLTSFRDWPGEVNSQEDQMIFASATDIAIEYAAEKIALERGGFELLAKCRGRVSNNYEWVRFDLKQFKKNARAIKSVPIPTRKEYATGTNFTFLAYRMAWKKSGYGGIYSKLFEASRKQIKKLYAEYGLAEKLSLAEEQADKYCQELEGIFDDTDLNDIRAIREALYKFIFQAA